MNCISKYIVTTEDERRVLSLARKLKKSHFWTVEDREFFHNRYKVSRDYIRKFGSEAFFFGADWDREVRNGERACIKEAQSIKRREIDPKNLVYNLGVLSLQGLVGGLITVVGACGGGVHFIPDEDAYRLNYKTE